MLCLFGCSWPFNIAKALRTKTAKGKSVVFEVLVIVGYLIGLFGKLYAYRQTGTLAYSVWFYIADILMVSVDLVLYCINTRRDKLAAQG
jgi:cbb3-type cytochrome oxidase subunit 1